MFTKRLSRPPRSVNPDVDVPVDVGFRVDVDADVDVDVGADAGAGAGLPISGRRLASRVLVAALCAAAPLVAVSPPAVAADRSVPADRITAADRLAIETAIRQQLDAFGHDDAERAFAFATPDIQRMFGSSDSFMRMVRDHYEPVYRSTGIQFERLTAAPATPASPTGVQWTQIVRLTDDEGKVWRALFTMRRQADRGWKIGGCQLVETSALST